MRAQLSLFAAALWWGSLTAIGFVTVPLLFANLPTPAMAGTLAAKLFTALSWISLGCGLLLLVTQRARGPEIDPRASRLRALILVGLLLALLSEYAVAPRIVARDNLALWHAVGSAMYLLQWLATGAVLWKMKDRA